MHVEPTQEEEEDDSSVNGADSHESEQGEEEKDENALDELSEAWLLAQMKHKVSAAAANSFWDLAMNYIPLLDNKNKVPKFIQQRRKLYRDYCPEVKMQFCYRNKSNGTIFTHDGLTAPVKMYQKDSKYEKLYEVAYVQVI